MKTFKEIQRFDQWWLRLLLVVILAIAVSPIVLEWDTLDLSRYELASVILSILVVLALFLGFWYIFKLETTIDEKGITYRFVPFHIKSRRSCRILILQTLKPHKKAPLFRTIWKQGGFLSRTSAKQ